MKPVKNLKNKFINSYFEINSPLPNERYTKTPVFEGHKMLRPMKSEILLECP